VDSEDRRTGVGLVAITTNIAIVAQSQQRKDVVRKLLDKYRCTAALGAEKFEASSSKEMVKRHLWHPSNRSMIARLLHLAPANEQSCEIVRDIARQMGCRRVFAAATASG
jgi:hypothetical protein